MRRNKKNKTPKVNEELKGFDIRVNHAGEIEYTHTVDEINKFLNRHVDDKKLRDREDLEN